MVRLSGNRWAVPDIASGLLPDCNPIEVFYWSIEIRVNAAVFSAKIAETIFSCSGKGFRRLENRNAQVAGPGQSTKVDVMADLLNLAMLICASVGAMAFGILAAYGILRAGFALMRPQTRPAPVKARPEVARVL